MKEFIYFDNAATTYPKSERVYKAMEEANRRLAVNAGRGSYRLAKKAASVIEETRKNILKLAKAEEVAEVVFTPSATLACNQVLGGLSWKKENTVYVTPYEHNAVMRVLHLLQQQYGFQIEELAIAPETLQLDMEKIKYQFGKRPPNVVVMSQVSNVTGYIVPWKKIAREAQKYEPVVIIDGSQGFGLVSVQLKNTPVDFYIFAGHKTLYGPLGVGGYINNRGKHLKHLLAGGTGSDSLNLEMPEDTAGYEPGSHNIVAIAVLLEATREILEKETSVKEELLQEELVEKRQQQEELWQKRFQQDLRREQELRQYLEEKLSKIPGVILYLGKCEQEKESIVKERAVEERTGIVPINIEGYKAADVGMVLDEDYNIAVRTGYHCAPLIHKYLKDEEYAGVVRISLGKFNTKEEIDYLVKAVEEIAMGW